MAMSEDPNKLQSELRQLHYALRDHTRSKYNRINPFYEDLFDWRERGEYWAGSGKNITIYNSTTLIQDVSIGDNTWIGPFCLLDGTGKLTIGSFCSISLGCQLVTHDSARWALSGGRAPYEYAPIKVGNSCYLGSHAVVVKGVSIGDHCLIGAGAVVTKDVADYSIMAGVPASRIGTVKIDGGGQVEFEYHK